MKLRLLALLSVLILLLAACGDDDDTTEASDDTAETTEATETTEEATETTEESMEDTADEGDAAAADGELIVGVSWNNYNEERWAKSDEPAIQAALDAAGATYISSDAGSSAEQQLTDVENLIAQGANALIILAQDGTAILPAVQSALDQGVPVISYDRLIEDPGTLYVTFDNVDVGRKQAEVIYSLVPEGNYVIIKGNQADANADFLRAGMEEIIGDAVTAGEAAVALAAGTALADVAGVVQFDSPGGNSMTSILLEPIPITQDNLQVVLDAEWIDEATLCQDVPSGSVAACP